MNRNFASLIVAYATLALAPQLVSATMFVTSRNDNRLVEFNETTGALITSLNVANGPDGVTVYNSRVYVSSKSHTTAVYDANTLAPVFSFPTGAVSSEESIEVGADGRLYMADFNTTSIARFNAATGAYLGPFASVPVSANTGLTFGPDGNLYATSQVSPNAYRVNGSTGAYMGPFTSGVALNTADGLTFGPDGNLYVSNRGANRVERFNGTTGAFLSTFATVADPHGLGFGPDGNLYVVSGPQIARIHGLTGAVLGTFGSGLLSDPQNLAFVPEPSSLALAGLTATGLAVLSLRRRRKGKPEGHNVRDHR